MQIHHKLETANKPKKCDPDFLKSCNEYYHKGGGKQRQQAWIARMTPEQVARKNQTSKEWKERNRVRASLSRWAARTKFRASKNNPAIKSVQPWEIIGCSVVEMQSYLEGMFREGIGWHNRSEWEIDHIRPLCEFDLTDGAQVRECLHFSNVQILITGRHLDKAKQEAADFMRKLAAKHWSEHESGEYPGFSKAWRAFGIWRQRQKAK